MLTIRTRILQVILSSMLLASVTYSYAADTEPGASASSKALTSKHFVTTAAADGLFEVEAGKLAAERATRPEVKTFANRMVTDHSAANEKLESLAKAQNITVPKKLDAKHAAKLAELKAKNGAEFDNAYVAAMTKGHHKAVALFTAATSSPEVDASLKDFAQQTLPTLHDHNSKVQQLHH